MLQVQFVELATPADDASPVILGNLSANQLGRVTAAATNTFQLVTLDGSGIAVAGSGVYTSGGWAVNITQPQFVADIIVGNCRVGSDATIPPTSTTSPFTKPCEADV